MGEDEKTKILWWLAAVFLGGIGTNQAINKVTPSVRYDPFTATDFETRVVDMEERLKFYVDRKTFDIRKAMPPPATRVRIRAMEHCLERNCQDFRSQTNEW